MSKNNILDDQSSAQSMWELMEKLFPIHRSLVGPGFKKSLEIVAEKIPLDIQEFPSGMECFDWTIPRAFKVNAAYVEAPDRTRPIDFERCNYHVWNSRQLKVLRKSLILLTFAKLPTIEGKCPILDGLGSVAHENF